MKWGNCFARLQMVSLVSIVFLSGCANPPITGDIVIGRASPYTAEAYRDLLQWQNDHPEAQRSVFGAADGVGAPRRAFEDGRVLAVSCQKHSNYGLLNEIFYVLLPNGVKISDDSPVVVFEAVSSNWDRATQTTTYRFSRFIQVSDLSYHDVPRGCLWYHDGKLVEGFDDSYGWSEGRDGRKRPPNSLEDFRSD